MRYLTAGEVLQLHELVAAESGGAVGIRDMGALESALAQPFASFGGTELHPSLEAKAAATCFYLVQNHPFIDGNKRTGHAAMAAFLRHNGYRINAPVEEQEERILALAAGEVRLAEFAKWMTSRLVPLPSRQG